MEAQLIENREELLQKLHSITYGSIYVILKKDDLRSIANMFVTLVDAIYKDMIFTSQHPEIDPDCIRIAWAETSFGPPKITKEEISFLFKINQVKRDLEKQIVIPIRPELHKYAKKECIKIGLKCSFFNNEIIVFKPAEKSISAYKLIEQAIAENKPFVEFSRDDVNPQTIRVYSSQINKFTGKKTTVKTEGNKIIFLLEGHKKSYWEKQFDNLIEKMAKDIGDHEAEKVIDKNSLIVQYFINKSMKLQMKPLNHQYINEAIKDFDERQIYKENKSFALPKLDHEPTIEKVDGLKQYTVPINEPEPNEPEDDGFN